MTATINNLWSTHRRVLSYNNSDTDRPTTMADLKKCTNVLVGDKIPGTPYREIIVNDDIVWVEAIIISHPSGGGRMRVLEVI